MLMKTILKIIDRISDRTANVACWLCLALVLLMTYDVVMRYVFTAPTMWAYESSLMLGATIYALGWSYVLRHHGHIRVDVIYTNLSLRGKSIINVVGTLLFFFPLTIALIYRSGVWAWQAWLGNEKMVETYWYPPAGPLYTVIMIGFLLLLLQGGAEFFRDSYLLIRNKTYD